MPRLRPTGSAILLLAFALVGCGGSGGLLATVPPPVEFAGLRVSGINELPPAGTYAGTLTIDEVEYRYVGSDDERGEWTLVEANSVAGPVDAEAIVAPDGTIVLRDKGGESNTFTGAMKVSTDPLEPVPTATLVAPDGSSALYPYALRKTEVVNLAIVVHGKVRGARTSHQRFIRYTFDLYGAN